MILQLIELNTTTLLSARLQPTCGQISSFTELFPDEKFKSRRDNPASTEGDNSIAGTESPG